MEGLDNNPYHRYLQVLVAARKELGLEAVERDPIEGLDWEADYYNAYQEYIEDVIGGSQGSGGTILAPSPRKGRSGVG